MCLIVAKRRLAHGRGGASEVRMSDGLTSPKSFLREKEGVDHTRHFAIASFLLGSCSFFTAFRAATIIITLDFCAKLWKLGAEYEMDVDGYGNLQSVIKEIQEFLGEYKMCDEFI